VKCLLVFLVKEGATVGRAEIIEEYKIALDQVKHLENNIWSSSGFISFGNIISLFTYSSKESSFATTFIVGAFSIIITTIWWGMCKRWWDIQHTILLRMNHLERLMDIRIQSYIIFRDSDPQTRDSDGLLKQELSKKEYYELCSYDTSFHLRGVQKTLKYLPISIIVIWSIFFIFKLLALV